MSASSVVGAVSIPFFSFGITFTPQNLAAHVLLASPFLVLLFGHLYLCTSWRRNMALVLANLLLWCIWLFAAAVMWYFQAGWYGVAVFTPVMAGIAGLLLLASLRIREPA
ncbi:hypothetical protein [Methylibium sp.]|uniref:hypothetical protein n=1 Tax=Methylibium sp. TaxID=2067992 RepID=UPI002DBF6EC9|nr:hypothetical protein [Methylibium sp.]